MIHMLEQNRNYRFIWAEMSFLSLWWDQATPEQQSSLKKLIASQQLEILSGGQVNKPVGIPNLELSIEQVMNDEANTHYFSMIDQLIEGHQFIENKLGLTNR